MTLRLMTAAGSCVLMMTAVATAAASKSSTCDFGAPHPDAPAEFRQYDFLIGNFRIEARAWRDGAWTDGFQAAQWNGRYILGGMAVMDEWWDADPTQNLDTERGANVRMYDSAAGHWRIMWLHTGEKKVVELHSKVRDDGKMHLWRVTHPIERRVYFENYGPGHWARLDYRKSDKSGQWEPKYKLEAFLVPCKE